MQFISVKGRVEATPPLQLCSELPKEVQDPEVGAEISS